MTAVTVMAGQSGTVLYPVYPQAAGSRCNHCWQPGPSALCADPYGPGLLRLCAGCRTALSNGRHVRLTVEQLSGMWEWLARQHINHRAGEDTDVTAELIDEAIHHHSPLRLDPGWEAFEGLMEDLLTHQEAETGDVDYASLEPEWRDAEVYANHCRGLVEDAVARLVGRTS